MKFVKTTGRIFNIDRIACALVYPEQAMVFSEDYHPVTLVGEDAAMITATMKEAGFVGEETLFHPTRVSVAEDAGASMRLYLAGSDRIITVPRELIDNLLASKTVKFPAQETAAAGAVAITRRKKGAQ